jgi:hypothetical protein
MSCYLSPNKHQSTEGSVLDKLLETVNFMDITHNTKIHTCLNCDIMNTEAETAFLVMSFFDVIAE